MKHVAFAGLGSMGLPMATNLLKHGFTVCGFDLRDEALAALRRSVGSTAGTAAEAAAGADMLVLMVVNAAQAESVLFDAGALEAMPADAIVVLMATCAPGAVESIAQRVSATGRRFIDAPVSGGVAGAVSGTLTIMAAAPPDTYAEARGVFEAMGKRVFHVGERPGQGAAVKTVNQLVCGVHIAVLAEAFALATKVGVDQQVVYDIMSGSSAASWMLNDRGPRMLQSEPEITSAIDIFVKDLGIVMQAGQDSRAPLPIAAAAQQMFLAASARGLGSADDSQVIQSYYALNGADPHR